jgi:putative sterol carrier protein
MADEIDINSIDMTPEQFAEMVRNAGDSEIETGMRTVGLETVLDRIFAGMVERFDASKAADVTTDIQWVVTDQGNEHAYLVSIKDGACTAGRGRADAPRVGFTLGLVPFMRLISGQENGVQLFMKGALKVTGDLMFSQRVQTFFATV